MYQNQLGKILVTLTALATLNTTNALECPSSEDLMKNLNVLSSSKTGEAQIGTQKFFLVQYNVTRNDFNKKLLGTPKSLHDFITINKNDVHTPRKLNTPDHYCAYNLSVGEQNAVVAISDSTESVKTIKCPSQVSITDDQIKNLAEKGKSTIEGKALKIVPPNDPEEKLKQPTLADQEDLKNFLEVTEFNQAPFRAFGRRASVTSFQSPDMDKESCSYSITTGKDNEMAIFTIGPDTPPSKEEAALKSPPSRPALPPPPTAAKPPARPALPPPIN